MLRDERRAVLMVFAACALPRVMAAAAAGEPFQSDYVRIADSVARGDGFQIDGWRATFQEPLYPLFLAAAGYFGHSLVARLAAQIVVVSAGGVCLYLLTHRLTGSRRSGFVAAGCYAMYPYLLWQTATFSGAAFGAALLGASLLAFDSADSPRTAAAAGVCFGLLMLTRFSYAPLAGAAAVLLAVRGRFRESILLAATALLIVVPWIVRTHRTDGGFVPSRMGLVLYLGTCEYASLVPRYDTDVLIGPTYERLRPLLAAHPPELVPRAADALLAREALACATRDPLRTARMGLRRAVLTFSPRLMPYQSRGPESKAVEVNGRLELRSMLPRPLWAAGIHAASTGLLIVAGLYGVVQRTSRRNAMLLLTIASFVIVNGVFMLSTRLTSPMYVVLMCYAGAAAARSATPA